MASFKFTNFFLMLMFVLQCSDANSQIPQGKDNIAGVVVGNINPSATEIKFVIGSVLTPKEPRKMMKRRVLMEMEKAKKICSKESVAIPCSDDKGEQKWNADCKRSSRMSGDRRAARKFKLSSFMALNADYHPPKSHAPKNN